MPIPTEITRDHISRAIEALRRGEPHRFGESRDYDVVHDGARYPPKAVVGLTAQHATGREYGPDDFSSGVERGQAVHFLRGLGFEVVSKQPSRVEEGSFPFEVGSTYERRTDIHGRYGGQQQGGISTPADASFIFLFTGSTGEQFGYHDGWDENGVFLYTGEGQVGDMGFLRGNRAIRDHPNDGKQLLLFEVLEGRGGCRYVGSFACATWEFRRGVDREGTDRLVIVFHLVPEQSQSVGRGPVPAEPVSGDSLEGLRQRAHQAAQAAPQSNPAQAKRTYYERSQAVRQYVLARANGVCESCRRPAPFGRPNGSPYLEPHHTRRLSDGGPDHPRWVGGICPNCHAEIHHGVNGYLLNERLQQYLDETEAVPM